MSKNIEDVEFVIFDTETTGLEPSSGDRIVEIAAIRFKGNERISEFQSLINPGRPVSAGAFAVNKISPEMLEDAPHPEIIIPKFIDFIQGACVCSYNAGFDLEFLENELKILNLPAPKDILIIDALKMAKRVLPGLERYALWFVTNTLGIKIEQKHRAFSDVELTLAVFNKLKDILKTKGVTDFDKYLGLFSIDPQLLEDLNNQKIAQIQEALSSGVQIKIEYIASSNAQVTRREVAPKEIKRENGRDYLFGYCCLKRQECSFKVDNILHIELVKQP